MTYHNQKSKGQNYFLYRNAADRKKSFIQEFSDKDSAVAEEHVQGFLNVDGQVIIQSSIRDSRRGQEFIRARLIRDDGRNYALIGEYTQDLVALNNQGTRVSKNNMEITFLNANELPIFATLISHDQKMVDPNAVLEKDKTKVYFDNQYKIDADGRNINDVFVTEKRPLSGGNGAEAIYDQHRYRYINGELAKRPKKRTDITERWFGELHWASPAVVLSGLIAIALVLATWIGKGLRKIVSQKVKRDSCIRKNAVIEELQGASLIENYGFYNHVEEMADQKVDKVYGESQVNQKVNPEFFDEYKYSLQHFFGYSKEDADAIIFTREDRRLYERIYIVAAQTRHASAYVLFLFHITRMMRDHGYMNQIANAIIAERKRIDGVIRNGAGVYLGMRTKIPMSTYLNYDDIDELFRTPKYVQAYIDYFWNAGNKPWDPTHAMREENVFPVTARTEKGELIKDEKGDLTFTFKDNLTDAEKQELIVLLPYKTMIEVSGGEIMGLKTGIKGMLQSVVNLRPVVRYLLSSAVIVFGGLAFTHFGAVVGAFVTGGLFGTWVASELGIWGMNHYFQTPGDKYSRQSKKRFGKIIRPYEDRKAPEQKVHNWIQRGFWAVTYVLHIVWNWYVFGKLIGALTTVGWNDPIIFSNLVEYLKSPFNWGFYFILGFWILPKIGKVLKSFGITGWRNRLFSGPITLVFSAIPLWVWWFVGSYLSLGGVLTWGILVAPFLFFFYLDSFSIFYVLQGILAKGMGAYLNKKIGKNWDELSKEIANDTLWKEYTPKLIPEDVYARLNDDEREVAFARYWNMVIRVMKREHILTPEEMKAYSYRLEGVSGKYLGAKIIKRPNLKLAPQNSVAKRRFLMMHEQMKMDMPRKNTFDDFSLSLMLPVYNEGVLYRLNESAPLAPALNSKYDKGGHTFLTYLIEKNVLDWNLLISHLSTGQHADEYRDDLDRMMQLRRGEELIIKNSHVRWEVEMWASARFQPLGRTIRGIMHYVEALDVLARISYSDYDVSKKDEWDQKIKKKIDDSLQLLVSYQTFGGLSTNVFESELITKVGEEGQDILKQLLEKDVLSRLSDTKVRVRPRLEDKEDLVKRISGNDAEKVWNILKKHMKEDARRSAIIDLMKKYPRLQVAYLNEKDDKHYSILMQGVDEQGQPVEKRSIKLDGKAVLGQGKPENQNHEIVFVENSFTQVMDINQDFYIEDAFMMGNALEEFKYNDDLVLLGLPEDVFTEDYSYAAGMNAHADRTFVTTAQRTLNLIGKSRYHYGHPDVYRTDFLKTMGGVSKGYVVNEDIYGAYNLTSKGKLVDYIEYVKAGKAREASFSTVFGLFVKFGAGATEQILSRAVPYVSQGSTYGNVFDRQLRMLTLYFGGIGFYHREPIVYAGNMMYVIMLIFVGISGFAAFPLEISLAYIGMLIFGQAITLPGLVRLWEDFGYIEGTLWWGYYFIFGAPFFQAHIMTHVSGDMKAYNGEADYVATGRGPGLEHRPLFNWAINSDKVDDRNLEKLPIYNYEATHLTPGLVGMVISGLGIWLFWNPTLILSTFVMMFFISAYYIPVFVNPVSTPLDSGVRAWEKWYYKDIANWIKVLWMGGQYVEYGNPDKEKFVELGRVHIFVHGVLMLVTAGIVGLFLSLPAWIKSFFQRKEFYKENVVSQSLERPSSSSPDDVPVSEPETPSDSEEDRDQPEEVPAPAPAPAAEAPVTTTPKVDDSVPPTTPITVPEIEAVPLITPVDMQGLIHSLLFLLLDI